MSGFRSEWGRGSQGRGRGQDLGFGSTSLTFKKSDEEKTVEVKEEETESLEKGMAAWGIKSTFLRDLQKRGIGVKKKDREKEKGDTEEKEEPSYFGGSTGTWEGFANKAERIMGEINKNIEKQEEGDSGQLKIVLSGLSETKKDGPKPKKVWFKRDGVDLGEGLRWDKETKYLEITKNEGIDSLSMRREKELKRVKHLDIRLLCFEGESLEFQIKVFELLGNLKNLSMLRISRSGMGAFFQLRPFLIKHEELIVLEVLPDNDREDPRLLELAKLRFLQGFSPAKKKEIGYKIHENYKMDWKLYLSKQLEGLTKEEEAELKRLQDDWRALIS